MGPVRALLALGQLASPQWSLQGWSRTLCSFGSPEVHTHGSMPFLCLKCGCFLLCLTNICVLQEKLDSEWCLYTEDFCVYHFIFDVCAKLFQSCPTVCDPMDCSLPGSSVHGILQARVLEWVAVSFLDVYLSLIPKWSPTGRDAQSILNWTQHLPNISGHLFFGRLYFLEQFLSSQQNWAKSVESLHYPLTPHKHSLPHC